MLNFKSLKLCAISIIALGLLTISCQKESIDPISTEQVKKTTYNSIGDTMFIDSFSAPNNRSWNEVGYNAALCLPYSTAAAVKLSDNSFRFAVTSTSTYTTEEMYVKFYCHTDGYTSYVKMECLNPLSSIRGYRLDKVFSNSADYSYQYFVRQIPATNTIMRITPTNGSFATLVVPGQGDNYHNVAAHIYAGNGMYMDQWNFYYEECVSWVACKVNEMWGTYNTFHNKMFGEGNPLSNASTWKNKFIQQGYSVDQNPQPGDIMWYPATTSMPNGHVAFVHSVSNGVIYYSYYNDNGDHQYHQSSIPINTIGNKYFIHIQQKL